MTPLYTKTEFEQAKSRGELKLCCEHCHNPFLITKKAIQDALRPTSGSTGSFCSRKCAALHSRKRVSTSCSECGKSIERKYKEYHSRKNHFCTQHCVGVYYNKHKKYTGKRSKMEKWLEVELTQRYPQLNITFNDRELLGLELDIYIPELNKAIEINGIFHYKPIFGEEQWKKIQNNDMRKITACAELGLELMVVDIQNMKYFKPAAAKHYLVQICSFIDS